MKKRKFVLPAMLLVVLCAIGFGVTIHNPLKAKAEHPFSCDNVDTKYWFITVDLITNERSNDQPIIEGSDQFGSYCFTGTTNGLITADSLGHPGWLIKGISYVYNSPYHITINDQVINTIDGGQNGPDVVGQTFASISITTQ